jgi:hypothetical protein
MIDPSINDDAVRACALLAELSEELKGINDYGENTGFCDDQDDLVNDAHATIRTISRRASRLLRRIRRHKASNP